MWKIATVMLTTVMFAGLLIVEPYGQDPSHQPTVLSQTAPQSSTSSTPEVVQEAEHTAGEGEQSPAPAPTQSAVEQTKKQLVSVAPNRVRTGGNRRTTTNKSGGRTRTAGRTVSHRSIG